MKTCLLFLSLFIVLGGIACTQPTTPSSANLEEVNTGSEVVKINGQPIRQGYLDVLSEINPRIKAQLQNPGTKRQFLDNLVDQELLYLESVKRGLNQRKDVAQKAAVYTKIIVSQALIEDELQKKAKDYYEKNKEKEFTKIKVSHIQVDVVPEKDPIKDKDGKDNKKDEAVKATPEQTKAAKDKINAIYERLKKGEDFAKLAEELSDDKTTKKKGGDFGSISQSDKRLARRGFEPLGEAAFKLKNGEFSAPIETKKSFHIVKVTSDPTPTPFEEAEKVLRFQLQKDIKDSLVTELKKSAKIEFDKSIMDLPQAPAGAPETSLAPDGSANPPTEQPQPIPTPEGKPKEPVKGKPILKTGESKKGDDEHNHQH